MPSNLRVLNLFFDLFTSERGRTKDWIRASRGYAGLNGPAFESAFQRDKDALREAGVVLEINGETSAGRYRVSADSFVGAGTHLTRTDLSLVQMAVDAWSTAGSVHAQALLPKLAARSDDDGEDVAFPLVLGLDGADAVTDILQAIEGHQPVGFSYTSASGTGDRAVEPWRLILRGRGLYLWGWDLDREAPRLFRLSRLRSGIELLGEPGDAHVGPEDASDPFESLLVEPLVRVRHGGARQVRLHCVAESEPTDADPDGWEILRGVPDEIGDWISLVLPEASDAVVLEPPRLREAVLTRLRGAVSWRPRTKEAPDA